MHVRVVVVLRTGGKKRPVGGEDGWRVADLSSNANRRPFSNHIQENFPSGFHVAAVSKLHLAGDVDASGIDVHVKASRGMRIRIRITTGGAASAAHAPSVGMSHLALPAAQRDRVTGPD